MRIRRSAARLLGSAYSAPSAPPPDAAAQSELMTTPLPPPPFYMESCSAPESRAVGGFAIPATDSGETCELSRSPWDLIAELSLSDLQVEDDLVGKYFVSVTCRPSWLFTASMPDTPVKKEKQAVCAGMVDGDSTTNQPRQEVQKKVLKKLAVSKKESAPKKKTKVKKEEDQEVKQPSYKCKKNDGKRWHCSRPVSHPNSLCDYHFYRKGAYLNPAALVAAEAEVEAETEMPQPAPASKPATSSKSRKKKPIRHDFGASEGFYYYAGFGPCRSKRHCRSSSINEYVPVIKKEEEELAEDGSLINEQAQAVAADTIPQAAGRDGKSRCDAIAGIAGVDEESSDDHYEVGSSGRGMNGSGEHRVGNFDGKMGKGWKRRRKPVKARSLKSLM